MDGRIWIEIPYRVSNIGGSWSGSMFAKIYANKPICLEFKAALNPMYETESFINYTKFDPAQIASGVSIEYKISFITLCDLQRDVPMKINYVLSYGNDKSVEATFNVIVRN